MNLFTDVIFIFVFVFVILHFGVVVISDPKENNIIKQKFMLFIAVTIFSWLLYAIKSIRCKTPIQVWDIINSGLIIGMLAYVGHTVYYDLMYMDNTNEWLNVNIFKDSAIFNAEIALAMFVSFAILFGKSIGYIFIMESCDMMRPYR
jgi:DNA integrity scanning protein DisA with diadenylate cyclase activity